MEEVNTTIGNAEINSGSDVDEKQWLAHVKYAQDFLGSDAEYCRCNKLDQSTFKRYKKRFGFSRPYRQRSQAFVKVERRQEPESTVESPIIGINSNRSPRLPDAGWTAEFIAALMAAHRQ
jgi:hypothetical protein